MPPAPLLLLLPTGLSVSGITTPTVNLANALSKRGHPVALVLHPEPAGSSRLEIPLDAGVRVSDLRDLPGLESAEGDLGPWIGAYTDLVLSLHREHGRPVVAFPNALGDAFGLLAAVTLDHAEALRIVGWQQNDIAYDARVLAHYEPVLTAMVAVSKHLRNKLAAAMPHRAEDCLAVTTGVPLGPPRAGRPPRGSSTLRLLYAGRLEHPQKRIGAVPVLSAELARRGVPHELTIVGDGPARGEIARAVADKASIRLLPPTTPAGVLRLLQESDYFVLPSRYEGLSVAMLEAMSQACVPAVTRVESGLAEAITPGVNGLVADAGPDDDADRAGRALADVIQASLPRLEELAAAAHETVARRFSLDRFADDVSDLVERAARAPARRWPAHKPAAFTARPGAAGGSGTVPADAGLRLRATLDGLAGRRVLIHGVGRHTLELRDVLVRHVNTAPVPGPSAGVMAAEATPAKITPAQVVAFADDDAATPARMPELWGKPVLAPAAAAASLARGLGATDVIISSWLHQDAIYARRAVYEAAGLRVHKLYD